MVKKRFFLSLKWQFSLIFGSVFLIFLSLFSYRLYIDTFENFESSREKIAINHITSAHTLTEIFFVNLNKSIELFLIGNQLQSIDNVIEFIDKNLGGWLLLGNIENAIFFDRQGRVIKRWESLGITPNQKNIITTLKSEAPTYQIECRKKCYQIAIVPILVKGELVGALSVARSFADIIINYKKVTYSDIAILVTDTSFTDLALEVNFAGMTNPNSKSIFALARQQYSRSELLSRQNIVMLNNNSYEIKIFPIQKNTTNQIAFFMVMVDISQDLKLLKSNLNKIVVFGLANFLIALIILLIVIKKFLKRIKNLSTALPLLANQKYNKFKQKIAFQPKILLVNDELDLLNNMALNVSDKLETLEIQVKKNTHELLIKSEELALERDFIQQLIEVAPIIIILQDLDGEVISVNKAGINALEIEKNAIIGKNFSSFIPKLENEHLRKINQLKQGNLLDIFEIDGILLTSQGNCHIAWVHSLIKGKSKNTDKLILTLGINISERKRVETEMVKMATEDPLTGLKNRKIFHSDLENQIDSAKRYGFLVALFYLDLDQFKIINENSNHAQGDRLLIQVTKQLKKLLHNTDALFRIGGDEFSIIMQTHDTFSVEIIAAKINRALSQLEYQLKGKLYKVSVSTGIALYPTHGKNKDELLTYADLAMYRAKEQGGGQYHIYSPTLKYHTLLTQNHYWRECIEQALIHDHFVLFYQPILNIKTNVITHYECLIRMHSEEGTLVMPDEFIGVAENLGIIEKIDRWVIKMAIKKHTELKRCGKHYKMSINLSGASFNDTSIFETISDELNYHDVDAKNIIFEITETSAVSNFLAAQSLIQKIKKLGCAFALDDFGVGFSSFYYLKYLPADYVKIDGVFIRQVDKNNEDRIFVKALTEVSQALGKKVIAEFVENEAILDILKEFGIEYAQGYLIGKPGPLN
ncbi:MAG: EAL domain-containing protein [Methylococcales bacterium]|nr:EAL domain-containing protein [Methylococcales bacterium]